MKYFGHIFAKKLSLLKIFILKFRRVFSNIWPSAAFSARHAAGFYQCQECGFEYCHENTTNLVLLKFDPRLKFAYIGAT